MIERIVQLLLGVDFKRAAGRPDELQRAVAALLVEVACIGKGMEPSRRRVIRHLLASQFGLSLAEANRLLDAGEDAVRSSTHLLDFTEAVVRHLSPEGRGQIMEVLWRAAYADGRLEPEEDALLRRIGGLIGVADADRMQARRHALLHARRA